MHDSMNILHAPPLPTLFFLRLKFGHVLYEVHSMMLVHSIFCKIACDKLLSIYIAF